MAATPIQINFTEYTQRMKLGQGGRSLLLRAVGLTKNQDITILDATGGLLRDAFFMARFGGTVTAIERSGVLANMIREAWPTLPENIALNFLEGDAIHLIPQLPLFDVIYLDPMFNEIKSAKAKKDLQFLQVLHRSENDDSALLLDVALRYAKSRVVIKRSINAPFLGPHQPDWQLTGKTVRFDIFKLC